MAKADLKTKETPVDVDDFLDTVGNVTIRDDCRKIIKLMSKATNAEPKMWGTKIIGFGNQHLKYESGRELDWMQIGFSPRKANLTLYGLSLDDDLLTKLGKHKLGKGCLYFKRLSDIDEIVLEKLIEKSVENIKEQNKKVKE